MRLALQLHRLVQYLSRDAFGGPRVLKLSWVINAQKAGTLPFVAALMWYYGNTSPAAWLYLALHGSYGVCWVIKDLALPDRGWQQRVTYGGAALSFLLVLGPYWVAPWLLISGVLGPAHGQPSSVLMAAAVCAHTIGVALMMASDAQKNAVLRVRPGLIDDGMFGRVRHPNYLGEMLVYGAYALIVRHWIPWTILAAIWTFVFLTNMMAQDASLSRYPGWETYRQRAGLLLPKRPKR